MLTRLRDAYPYVASLKLCTAQAQCLLQAIERFEFYIAESFGLRVNLVLNYPYIVHLATGEEVMNIAFSGVKREIA